MRVHHSNINFKIIKTKSFALFPSGSVRDNNLLSFNEQVGFLANTIGAW